MICWPQAASRSLSNSKMSPHCGPARIAGGTGCQQLALGQRTQQVRRAKHGIGRQRLGFEQLSFRDFGRT